MGIFSIGSIIKNKVAGAVGKVAGVAGDVVSSVSVLSPKQLEEVANKKSSYFTELLSHNMGTAEASEFANRLIGNMSVEIYNAYLSQINEIYAPLDRNVEYGEEFESNFNIRYINITKWVTDKSENSLEKLVNVYEVLSNENCNIALIFNRKMEKTEVYIGVVNRDNDKTNDKVETYADRIADAIKGNFPGSKCNYDKKENSGRIPIFDEKHLSIASISNIPTKKSDKFNTQTIEKLIDGIVPDSKEKEWTLVLIASPILDKSERKLKIGEYYSALSPYKAWETNYTFLETSANTSASALGINLGGSSGVQESQSHSDSHSESNSETYSHSKPSDDVSVAGIVESVAGILPIPCAGLIAKGAGILINIGGKAISGAISNIRENSGEGIGEAIKHINDERKELESTTHTTTDTTTDTTTRGTSKGNNFGATFMRASAQTATIGKNEGITQHFENYNIKHTLDMLKEQMNRVEQSSALGLWDFAAYVLSEDVNVANNVAHSYLALTQGEKSYLTEANVNLWRGDLGENSKDAKEIVEYLRDLRHPIFGINPDVINNDPSFALYPVAVTATTELTGKELAYSLNFPKKSIAGLPIIECAEFGRSIICNDGSEIENAIELGKIYHMQHKENAKAVFSKDSLRKHTLICGDIGCGKTKASEKIIKEVINNGNKVLIIEMENDEYSSILNDDKISFIRYGVGEKDKKININLFKPNNNISYKNPLVELFDNYKEMDSFKSMFEDIDESVENILNNNVVINLSGIASERLKALIATGMLYKIKDYFEEKNVKVEQELKHLIVIEDFQRISELSQSNSQIGYNKLIYNLMSKFRKWGEGLMMTTKEIGSFDGIIIKETNNKIIFRLTDEEERNIAGKSIGLNDLQIDELAKIKDGVAVAYQTEWLQPVLFEID